jgi:hypothetical protein
MGVNTIVITGRVIERRTEKGVPGLRVEAWDKDKKYHDMLGQSLTDSQGRFRFAFEPEYFGDHAPDRLPDVFFRVYQGETLLRTTQDEPIRNMREKQREVVLTVDLPQARVGTDRLSASRFYQGVAFARKSDFKGLWREGRDKTGTVAGFAWDWVKSVAREKEIKPIRGPQLRTNDVVGQDVATAQTNLNRNDAVVTHVKPYQPGVGGLNSLTSHPVALAKDDEVTLYVEDGKVRYYTVDRAKAVAGGGAEDFSRLDGDVKGLKADVTRLKADKADSEGEQARLRGDVDTLGANVVALEESNAEARSELDKARRESENKNQQIASLQRELQTLRKDHQEFTTRFSPDTIERLQASITKLEEEIRRPSRRGRPSR